MSDWISAKEKLPEDKQAIYVYIPNEKPNVQFGSFRIIKTIYANGTDSFVFKGLHHEPDGWHTSWAKVNAWLPATPPAPNEEQT